MPPHLGRPSRPYRDILGILRQYEGWRCLWRVAVGGLLVTFAPVLPIGGFVAGAYLADDLHDPCGLRSAR